MPFSFKKLDKKAQHILEYAIILVLVIGGIIVMGPYVIRSWNAQVKGWEDSVMDSFNDPLTQAPSVTLPGCVCTWQDEGCGSSAGCSNLKQRYHTNLCLPAGCEDEMRPPPPPDKCVWDDSCCTAWSPANPTLGTDCGPNALPPCPLGQLRQTRECGETLTETRCIVHAGCTFNCLEPPYKITSQTTFGDLCTDDEINLTVPTRYSYVNFGDCTSGASGTKCEIECIDGAVSFFGQICLCPSGMTFDADTNRCECEPGWVKQESCLAQECYQGACGINQCEEK